MKKVRRTSVTGLIMAFTLLIATVGPVNAVPTYFTDRASFELAAGGGLLFESFENGWAPDYRVDFGGFTIEEESLVIGGDYIIQDTGVFVTDGQYAAVYEDDGVSWSYFDFTIPVTAFGLDITAAEVDPIAYINGDVEYDILIEPDIPQFWGVIDPEGLETIIFDVENSLWIGFDSVSYGTPTQAVPEPSTLLLLGSGILGIGIFRRKLKE